MAMSSPRRPQWEAARHYTGFRSLDGVASGPLRAYVLNGMKDEEAEVVSTTNRPPETIVSGRSGATDVVDTSVQGEALVDSNGASRRRGQRRGRGARDEVFPRSRWPGLEQKQQGCTVASPVKLRTGSASDSCADG